jgi:hypothetical protein
MPLLSMADAVAGQIALSAEYNKLIDNIEYLNSMKSYTKFSNQSAATITATTSPAVSTSISVTTIEANTRVYVRGYFDVDVSGGGDIFVGTCFANGATQTGEAHVMGTAVRATVALEWPVVLATVGAHTIQLRVAKVGSGGVVTVNGAGHTRMSVTGNGIS